MKRFVRNLVTRDYLGHGGQWTKEACQAQHFDSIHQVFELQRRLRLTKIELVLQMGEEPSKEYDIALPLGNA